MSKSALALSLLVLFIGSTILPAAERAPARPMTPGWLGLGFVLHRDPPRKAWLYVQRVAAGGPATRAGLRPQDVIVKINDKDITFASETAALDFFAARVAGEKVVFTVTRPQGRVRMTLIAARRPAANDAIWLDNYARAAKQDKARP